jgi:hypothetical protein
MNHRCQPSLDVTHTRHSATLSRRERGRWYTSRRRAGSVIDRSLSAPPSVRHPISARQCRLLTIVLQLQLSYCCSAHREKSAHNFGRLVRVGALTNRGAHKLRELVRTRFAGVIANRLQLQQPGLRGESRPRIALSVPQLALRLSPGRVARGGVDRVTDVVDRATPPPAYAAAPLSTGAKTEKAIAPLASELTRKIAAFSLTLESQLKLRHIEHAFTPAGKSS